MPAGTVWEPLDQVVVGEERVKQRPHVRILDGPQPVGQFRPTPPRSRSPVRGWYSAGVEAVAGRLEAVGR